MIALTYILTIVGRVGTITGVDLAELREMADHHAAQGRKVFIAAADGTIVYDIDTARITAHVHANGIDAAAIEPWVAMIRLGNKIEAYQDGSPEFRSDSAYNAACDEHARLHALIVGYHRTAQPA